MSWKEEFWESYQGRQLAASIKADWPPCPCKICGAHMEIRESAYQRLGVCPQCAHDVENCLYAQHGGRWADSTRVSPKVMEIAGHLVSDRQDDTPKKKTISKALALKVYERDGFKCVYCKAKKNLSCDHVTPESKGGETIIGNLVTACRSCNSKKQTKSLADFWGAIQ